MAEPRARVVFDTSVLVSFAGRPSATFATLESLRAGEIAAFTSDLAIAELREVLSRPELRSHYGAALDPLNIERFILQIRSLATVIADPPRHFIVQADPKDSLFVNLAIESKADFLVTFDMAHLLRLRNAAHPQYQELKRLAPQLAVVKPAELATLIRSRP